jgi:hydroxymethylbilane synthase
VSGKLVLGTRGSALALWQARHIAARLRETHPGLEVEERIIRTEGDEQQHSPLGVGDRGVFVRRIEQALLAGEIDLAVHSLKDLPTVQPDGLVLAAVPRRHDPRDVLITADGKSFEELAPGAVLGTGSFRRRCQLLAARPDLKTEPVRGNVDTRVDKLLRGDVDAMVLALAGLERLGIDRAPYRAIAVETCLPAVGQGALAVETRRDDGRAVEVVSALDDAEARAEVVAERAFLRRLGGGCLAPATGFARVGDGGLHLRAVVGDPDGTQLLRDEERGGADAADALGVALAERMIAAGAERILAAAREDSGA